MEIDRLRYLAKGLQEVGVIGHACVRYGLGAEAARRQDSSFPVPVRWLHPAWR